MKRLFSEDTSKVFGGENVVKHIFSIKNVDGEWLIFRNSYSNNKWNGGGCFLQPYRTYEEAENDLRFMVSALEMAGEYEDYIMVEGYQL